MSRPRRHATVSGPRRHAPRFALRDLLDEALAGMLQRPGRSALTALGTVLGVGAFVCVLGLTATASGQISKRFTAEVATTVTVQDSGGPRPDTVLNAFPADADSRVGAIRGVREAGVWWPVQTSPAPEVTGAPLAGRGGAVGGLPVVAASPGLLRTLHPTIGQGRLFDEYHDAESEQVVVLGAEAARRLGVSTLSVHPAVFIDGAPFVVIGLIDDVQRLPDLLYAAFVPQRTAQLRWGPPSPNARATMLVETDVGAAAVVGAQAALALRPDAPDLFTVITPPDARSLRDAVTTDLAVLFLVLAGVALVIGAVGIANTTMVAVLERVGEIGLRRALGARRRHVAAQFLAESTAIGALGGCVGASLGVVVVVGIALARHWTPVLEPSVVVPAPLAGALIGMLAGGYPALRAARIEPVVALRR